MTRARSCASSSSISSPPPPCSTPCAISSRSLRHELAYLARTRWPSTSTTPIPAIAIPELMRILMDEDELSWDEAEDHLPHGRSPTPTTPSWRRPWKTGRRTCSSGQLPRIYHDRAGNEPAASATSCGTFYPGQWERIGHMAILAYGQVAHGQPVRWPWSAFASTACPQIHTDILKKQTFRDYYVMQPEKFIAITNGITHRRWLIQCQSRPGQPASTRPSATAGARSRQRLKKLTALCRRRGLPRAVRQGQAARTRLRLADRMRAHAGNRLMDPDSIFDVQAKRLHEYKRQLMNALRMLMLYNRIVENPDVRHAPHDLPLRRQGLAGLSAGQAHHQADQFHRRPGEKRIPCAIAS